MKKLTLLLVGLATLMLTVLLAWYHIDGIPTEASVSYLENADYTTTELASGGLKFTPKNPNGLGLVIMHGALIYPQSYTKSAAYFARLGYTVILPLGTLRLSVTAAGETAKQVNQSNINDWYYIGHSMGGMATLETISAHGAPAKAIALWSSGMPRSYTELEIPILFIWGDTDGLLPEGRYKETQNNLPEQVEYVTLEGANHKNFALYSHQFFDNDASIDWMKQINFANETTADFFERHSN